MLQRAEITSIILYMLGNKKYLTLFSTVWAQRIKNKVLGRNCKCFISRKKQTTASINLMAVRHAMHTLGTLNENLSISFFCKQSDLQTGNLKAAAHYLLLQNADLDNTTLQEEPPQLDFPS